MARRRWMPIQLIPVDPGENYPSEAIEQMNAIAWGDLLWRLYRWGSTLEDFRYDNYGFPIREDICRQVADVIEAHLSELPDEERDFWERMAAHWRFSGGFFQRGARINRVNTRMI